MSFRVLAVTGPAFVRLRDRQVTIEKSGAVVGRVPLEDLATLVLDGPDLALTHQLLGACAEAGVLVVVTDERHLPNGLLLPLSGHSLSTATLRAQIAAGAPVRKRAWRGIVRAKIAAQADLVRYVGGDAGPLRKLIAIVRSGDPDNVEAMAAARAFEAVFGADFLRDRDAPGLNAMLNYGYAVLRGAVARAIVGAGLHPALGLHHHNQYNPLCLADDAMEPLRPMVDRIVWAAACAGETPDPLDPPIKRRLIGVLGGFVRLDGLRFPLFVGLERFAASLRRALCEGEELSVPVPDLDRPR